MSLNRAGQGHRIHFDPQIDHLETVIGQKNADQVFSDVVNIPFDGGQDEPAFFRTGTWFHEGFEIRKPRLSSLPRIAALRRR